MDANTLAQPLYLRESVKGTNECPFRRQLDPQQGRTYITQTHAPLYLQGDASVRSGGRVVMQRPAKPCTSVRFRPGPPIHTNTLAPPQSSELPL
jgi:hypothetical protein